MTTSRQPRIEVSRSEDGQYIEVRLADNEKRLWITAMSYGLKQKAVVEAIEEAYRRLQRADRGVER